MRAGFVEYLIENAQKMVMVWWNVPTGVSTNSFSVTVVPETGARGVAAGKVVITYEIPPEHFVANNLLGTLRSNRPLAVALQETLNTEYRKHDGRRVMAKHTVHLPVGLRVEPFLFDGHTNLPTTTANDGIYTQRVSLQAAHRTDGIYMQCFLMTIPDWPSSSYPHPSRSRHPPPLIANT
jgi:hypothetical protein